MKDLSEQGENEQQTQPTYDAGSGNRIQATLVGGERSHHCATLNSTLYASLPEQKTFNTLSRARQAHFDAICPRGDVTRKDF